MKNKLLQRRFFVLFGMTLLITVVLCFGPVTSTTALVAVSDPAIQAVRQAWEKAEQSNTYTFDTHIEQTNYPVPALRNVGRQPQIDTIYLSGQRDQAQDLLEMTLWQNARGTAATGLSVRSQNGRTYSRNRAGDWEEQSSSSDLFAPGGDPLTFLQTAQNIAPSGAETRQLGDLTLRYKKYTFDLDTAAYARVLRQQLAAQLEQYGRLPAGMTLETPAIYQKMTGQGMVWLDETGLPRRLEMALDMPPQGDNGRATAMITTDLSGFDAARIAETAVSFWQSPQTWLQAREMEIVTGAQTGMQTTVWVLVGITFLLIVVTYWHSRRFYAAVAGVIIISMLITPFLQEAHAATFRDNLQAAETDAEARQAKADAQADLQADLQESDWNPHQNPLLNADDTTDAIETAVANSSPPLAPALALASTITDTTDTDGDGLIDLDEDYWGTCADLGAPDNCTGVTDATDTDGDGLSDGVEVHELGTNPDGADSDLDSIPDSLEISGFDYNGQTWYLNPREEDTNKDGLIDGLECRIRTNVIPAEFDPAGICPDTDSDGTPDVFDDDNDGDGVLDAQDVSPFTVSADSYDEDNPLQLSIDNLALDKPVFVDLQFRPTTAVNLNLYNHVLDWPSQDTEGQIQRTLDTTWADTANLSLRSSVPNAANGDIRLVPMLEITMPYSDGHYANLPITTTAPLARTPGDSVDSWLDSTQLDPFGIAVNDIPAADGTLNAYLPLTQVTNRGGIPEAFAARMVYRPSQGTAGRADWGAAHEVRLIWFVQMIVDQCPAGYDDVRENDAYSCRDPETGDTAAREDVQTIAHVYPDTWQLTGLSVQEEHDFDMAILYEDPAQDTDLTSDDQLMVASWNLNNGFMIGRDCDSIDGNGVCQGDGQRDVTVTNMATAVPGWFTSDYYLTVQTYLNYDHGAYLGYLISREVEPLLDTTFAGYTHTIPTLLYAQDHTNRRLNLDDLTNNSSAGLVTETNRLYQFDLNPDDVVVQTQSSLSWTPYQYVNGSWQAADIESYLTRLDSRLQEESYFQPADGGDAARQDGEIKRAWIQIYYTTLWQGVSAWTEMDNMPLNARAQDPDIPEAAYDPVLAAGADYGPIILALAFLEILQTSSLQSGLTQLAFRGVSPAVFVTAFSIGVAATWVGIAFLLAGMIEGNKELVRTGQVILAVVNLAVASIYAINALYAISLSVRGIATAANQASNYPAIGPAGLAIGLAATWGLFIFQILTNKMSQVEIYVALSLAVATTIYLIILFLLSVLSLGVLGILLSLVDSIFLLLGKKAPTQYLIEFIAKTLYDIDLSITNLDSADRLSIQLQAVDFVNESEGFRVTNSLDLTMGITNTIKYHREFSGDEAKVAKRTVFSYTLQNDPDPFVTDLPYWDSTATDQWTSLSGRKLRTNSQNSIIIPLSTAGAGINQRLGVYYSEAFRAGYQSCWQVPVVNGVYTYEECEWNDFHDTIHYPLTQTLTFDIFPQTITQFAAMNWSDTGPTLPQPADYDADGLSDRSGTDPDYRFSSGFDADGDGLGDLYEVSNGYDATAADGDFDGLTDGEELFYGTNPFVADTDGDGLNDRVETVDGWLVVYNGNQLTRVWSDPLSVDVDQDGLSDRDEMIFGFNPWVATDPSRILHLVQFDDVGVVETGSPELLLRFEDAANSTAFFDSSGAGHHAGCVGTACPTVAENGRYGQSLLFDGANDLLLGQDVDFARNDYTVAFWFQSDATTDQAILSAIGADSNNYGILLQLEATGELRFLHRFPTGSSGGTDVYSPGTYNDGQWHHLAAVHESDTLRLYVDGSQVISDTTTGQFDESMNLVLGRLAFNTSRWFDGALDDLVIFDEALSVGEIDDVVNGRYNPDDRLLAPGTNLSYQAVVTNTSSTTASGFLVGENSYAEPEIGHPEAAFSFESSQRLVNFTNSVGDENSIVCIDNGTCPTAGVDGRIRNAIAFDGVDDVVAIPNFGGRDQIHFWLWVDSRPASGQVATILDTADELPTDFDMLLNDSGQLLLAVDGTVQFTSTATIPNSSWHHISYNGFYLYINGNKDGDFKYLPDRQVGYGRLGNNADGSAPFHGRLDEFVSIKVEDGSGGGISYNEIQDEIMRGDYYFNSGNPGVAHFPLFLYRLDELVSYDGTIFYDSQANSNHAICHAEYNTCPDLTTAAGGYDGRAVVFDGAGDYLEQPGLFTTDETTIRLYINPASYPTAGNIAYLYDGASTGSGNTLTFDLYMDENGRLTLDYGSGNTTYDTIIPLNQWSQIEVIFDRFHNGSFSEYRIYLEVDNVQDPHYAGICAGNGLCTYTVRVSHGRIGNNIPWDAPFDGMMDQLELGAAAYDFDPPSANVGYDNLANAVRTATCSDVFLCPGVGNGRYDQGLVLDGVEDYLDLGFVLDPAVQPFSVGVWFSATTVSNRPIILQQIDGSGTGRVWLFLESDGTLRSFLGGSTLAGTTPVSTDTWHHAAITYDGATLRLYLDGMEENSASRTIEASDGNLWLGRQKSSTTQYFAGSLDELVIVPGVVSPAGVQLLMNSTWPIIDVAAEFVPFAAPPLTSQLVSGDAPVSPYATTSQHRFDQEVEAALVLQAQIDYPVIDDNAVNVSLFIPFEDGPGSTVFDNLISYPQPNVDPDVEAYCNGNSCPTAGLRGQVERAAYFDGLDDFLSMDFEPLGYGSGPDLHSMAVWVNAEQGTILSANDKGNGARAWELDIGALTTVASSGYPPVSTNFNAPRNEWFHLAVTIDSSDVAHIYVNGVEVTTGTHKAIERFEQLIIGMNRNGQDFLQGYLDDLRLYNIMLTPAAVQTLYQESAPLMRFEFDEDEGATQFADNSVNQYIGQPQIKTGMVAGEPVSVPNPVPGTPGRIGNGIVLDGTGYVKVDAPEVASLTESFTIMGWIKPNDVSQLQRILSAGRSVTSNGFGLGIHPNGLIFTTFSVKDYVQSATLKADVWQHVAVVLDGNNDAHFYVDGELIGTITHDTPGVANPDDPFYIGANRETNGAFSQYFNGQIDELAVYGRGMSDAEIYGIYLRELRWYRDKATTYLTIDTDNPTIDLLSDTAYWPDGYIQLAVATTDATSAVTLLDFGLKAPGASDFTWQGAPACAESSESGAAWCPYFDSTQLGGEGVYELQFRAVDAVGNETLSAVYTLYVDGTPPTARAYGIVDPEAEPDNWKIVTPIGELRWTAGILQGALSDPVLANAASMAGSGLITESVRVQLIDEVGGFLSGAPQQPVITGSEWRIEYEMTGIPQGTYAIMLTLEDAVGNQHTLSVGKIRFDARLPGVDLYTGSLSTDVISRTTVLSGTITDLVEWGGTAVEHHFAEPAGATVFYNTGESRFYTPTHSLCSNCPTAGQPGLFGDAVQFDGIDDAITIPFVFDPITTTFAAAVWISPTQVTGPYTILAQQNGNGNGRSWLAINSAGMLETDLGGAVLSGTTAITTDAWQHVAVTYDGEIVRLFHNGRLEAAAARTIESADGDMRLGSNQTGTTPFPGLMDEFNLYHRTLTHNEVYALAQAEVLGVQAVFIGLEPADFLTDTISAPPDTLLFPNPYWDAIVVDDGPVTLAEKWQYPISTDLEGFYELHLRGIGGGQIGSALSRDEMVWRGLIDMITPTITVTAKHLTVTDNPVTQYSFTFSDFLLDETSYGHPCTPGDLVTQTYDDDRLPHNGQPYAVSGTCQVAGHETSRDFTVCDAVGHCATQTVHPPTEHTLTIVPENATDARFTWTQPAGYCGYALHRNETPYFGGGGTEIKTFGSGTHTDVLTNGLLTSHRFFTIVATDCVGGPSGMQTAVSNEVGVISMPIVGGD